MSMDDLAARAIAVVLQHEGGLVDDPADPGGVTNFGISLRAYPGLGIDGIRSLTRDRAAAIYFTDRWVPARWKELPEPLAIKGFDAAVNMGDVSAAAALQRACGACGRAAGPPLAEDGRLGDQTIQRASGLVANEVLAAFRSELAAHYRLIAATRPTSQRFLAGWLTRAYE